MAFTDPRPEYWVEYSNLQKVKHDLIREYLYGWYAKLGHWAGRIVYLDTHAGRGRHTCGQEGSPLVALRALLEHRSRERILAKSEAVFLFVERDEENAKRLRGELSGIGTLPPRITVEVVPGDCFGLLTDLVESLQSEGRNLAPAFVFVDPYGFKVPGRILRDLLAFPRVELFLNLIWRELDMAIAQGRADPACGLARTLDEIFDGDVWVEGISSENSDERAFQAAKLIRDMLGAKWATSIRMLGLNNVTRYVLLHLTNHDAGRDLMKDCMWKVCPDGGFFAAKNVDPAQQLLISPQADLRPLVSWVLTNLRESPQHWSWLQQELRDTLWRAPQLNEVVRGLIAAGTIGAMGIEGRITRKADPVLKLVDRS